MDKPHKLLSESEIGAFFECLHPNEIGIWVNVMVGFPTETRGEPMQTLRFVERTRHCYDGFTIQPFCLEQGTPAYEQPERFGIEAIDRHDKASGVRLGHAFRTCSGMSRQQARGIVELYDERGLCAINVHQ